MGREEFERIVVNAVTAKIGNNRWFRGVCLDGIDEYFKRQDLQGAIDNARDQTVYFDAPYSGLDTK